METIYKIVQKKDHSYAYAIFDYEPAAQAYTDYKNRWAGYELMEIISVEIDMDIYEDLFYPTAEQGEEQNDEDGQ